MQSNWLDDEQTASSMQKLNKEKRPQELEQLIKQTLN